MLTSTVSHLATAASQTAIVWVQRQGQGRQREGRRRGEEVGMEMEEEEGPRSKCGRLATYGSRRELASPEPG